LYSLGRGIGYFALSSGGVFLTVTRFILGVFRLEDHDVDAAIERPVFL
jgi:hypothetical protein